MNTQARLPKLKQDKQHSELNTLTQKNHSEKNLSNRKQLCKQQAINSCLKFIDTH